MRTTGKEYGKSRFLLHFAAEQFLNSVFIFFLLYSFIHLVIRNFRLVWFPLIITILACQATVPRPTVRFICRDKGFAEFFCQRASRFHETPSIR